MSLLASCKEVQEISPNLRYVIDELDQICQRDRTEIDLKRKIRVSFSRSASISLILLVTTLSRWRKSSRILRLRSTYP
jgi:hypothetical protein